MPYDEKLAERVRRVLSRRHEVIEKKLMGGLCFMVWGNMCCGVSHPGLLVRVGRERYRAALAEPYVRPLEFGGRRPSGFVVVDLPGYRTAKGLASWVQRGLDFALTLPPK